MEAVKHSYCNVTGTALYYVVTGSGTPVVFLHGNPVDHTCWDFQIPEISKHYQVIRYDLRGFGRSKPSAVSYSHADDLKSLLDYLKVEKAYLVGWSMGGGAVLNFTLVNPERVKGIVLIGSSLGGFPYSESFTSTYFVQIRNTAEQLGVDAAKKQLLQHPLFSSLQNYPMGLKKIQECLNNYSGWHWLNKDYGIPFNPPAIKRLSEINVPTLVMIGEHESPDFKEISEVLATNIAGAKKIEMADAGHALPLEKPDYFNKLVLDFIAGIEK